MGTTTSSEQGRQPHKNCPHMRACDVKTTVLTWDEETNWRLRMARCAQNSMGGIKF